MLESNVDGDKAVNWIRKLMRATPARVHEPAPNAKEQAPPFLATALLVDVRSTGEFDSGHIEGALSLPLDRIAAEIARDVPDKATPLLLYCRSGARSQRACEVVAQIGYTNATNGGGIGSLALRLNRTITPRR